ncbi:MAG: methylated-DNA--[protein]-cysteine S-methyltransferase [Rhodospirillales bacterium]|nr:methylated-DNA--[protein]-cysteine S-methyltransferase [Rhodospirillales bacterium]
MTLIFDAFDTPIGEMVAVFSDDALCLLDFSDCQDRNERLLQQRYPRYSKEMKVNPFNIRDRVLKYFKGDADAFRGLKLETGGTVFQQSVWRALQEIPHGKTLSYAELARNIDNPKAVRAVGSANGKNPIAIIIPCHRVIGSNGSLTGYAGGVDRKRQLLALEGAL